jgi:hypothetical protein
MLVPLTMTAAVEGGLKMPPMTIAVYNKGAHTFSPVQYLFVLFVLHVFFFSGSSGTFLDSVKRQTKQGARWPSLVGWLAGCLAGRTKPIPPILPPQSTVVVAVAAAAAAVVVVVHKEDMNKKKWNEERKKSALNYLHGVKVRAHNKKGKPSFLVPTLSNSQRIKRLVCSTLWRKQNQKGRTLRPLTVEHPCHSSIQCNMS